MQKWYSKTASGRASCKSLFDLEKMWKDPARSKIKAKVRVPRLKGGKMGVLATRSPHRPCPIGLSVAKIEAVDGQAILLSGVDLVDGTPVLDIKPYLPYSDSVKGATVPSWVQEDTTLAVGSITFSSDFASSLSTCWAHVANFKEELSPETANALNQVVYHLILEGIDVSYRIDENSNVVVEKANVHPNFANRSRYSYLAHRDKVR
ncbi:hypothetical protein FCM35_KLT16707 [Carex littledalei]|uniref:TsaA-like domain-containing protein n=1 Tax=Carex littledalei TaxID=544730 RepID=A0A833VI46_9POAL|nr:hypothetical protein FCM35_KLT16707 [Carex littledalei]